MTSVITKPPTDTEPAVALGRAGRPGVGARVHGILSSVPTAVLWLLVVLWTVPTLGVFVSSFRDSTAVRTTGWWEVVTDPKLTFQNYRDVFSSSGSGGTTMWDHFVNSVAITIPGTLIPLAFAAFAAYAFAWMDFKGRHWWFIGTVALLAIPLQMSLVPLLQLWNGGAHLTVFGETLTFFPDLDLQGTTTAVWLAHVGFGLPLAVFLLHNYMAALPRDIFEAARIDGADHPTIFWRLVLPLSVPALASFSIFQFLWVWNDFLIANTFLGSSGEGIRNAPMTVQVATLSGSMGGTWHLLTAAAFVSIALPLVVFFALQRYFVRGLLAGSVKG
jgi:alpha-glucoside transport system permease protein